MEFFFNSDSDLLSLFSLLLSGTLLSSYHNCKNEEVITISGIFEYSEIKFIIHHRVMSLFSVQDMIIRNVLS